MADAAAGKFDVVLVDHTSRFARNQVEALRYKQLLRERLAMIREGWPTGDAQHIDAALERMVRWHMIWDGGSGYRVAPPDDIRV